MINRKKSFEVEISKNNLELKNQPKNLVKNKRPPHL